MNYLNFDGAGGGTRTHTAIRPSDFKSDMSTIPSRPLGDVLERARLLGKSRDTIRVLHRRVLSKTAAQRATGSVQGLRAGQPVQPHHLPTPSV